MRLVRSNSGVATVGLASVRYDVTKLARVTVTAAADLGSDIRAYALWAAVIRYTHVTAEKDRRCLIERSTLMRIADKIC